MKAPAPGRVRRRPQARSLRNQASILDAGVAILAEEGWAGFNRNRIAKRVGLSYRPVFDRFPDRAGMAASVWVERVARPLIEPLNEVLAAAGLMDRRATADEFVWAAQVFTQPTPTLLAAAELLVITPYHPALVDTVRADLGERVGAWCGPTVPPPLAARRAYTLAIAFGLLFLARYPGADALDLRPSLVRLHRALVQPALPTPLPEVDAGYLDQPVVLAPDDPPLDALLQATLRVVAAKGFQDASIQEIARTAGFTPGLVFSRYSGKLDLFIDATSRHSAVMLRRNAEFLTALAERTSVAVAEAVAIRELQRPGREAARMLGLEQLRLMWHDLRLRDLVAAEVAAYYASGAPNDPEPRQRLAAADRHVGLGFSYGVALLAQLAPGVHELPYDVVTSVTVAAGG